ncbi:MAG: CRISPR system precrRNA processing endoribonuclease RAMP protein Cas6 [Eubacterium sp.]|nr:CRISPR system precrRNA processing endoribonuclease RAMP protein Cas6 [Eubacterium sp.]
MELTNDLEEALNIRYVRLHFTLVFPEDCVLPKYKASALRGGMGEMLLRANCIRDRKCENCDFETECIVRRTMYSKLEKESAFAKDGDSVGYVIECENYETDFYAGDTLEFYLILFGKTIVYFSQYMNAFYALGMNGLGRHHARFQIASVQNSYGDEILSQGNVYMEHYKVQTVADYVRYRLRQIQLHELEHKLVFKSAVTLKYHKEFLQEYNMDAIIQAVKRRISILDSFEGVDGDALWEHQYELPAIIEQKHRRVEVPRYSSRKNSKMVLKGIKGYMQVEHISEDLMPLLLAGELIHIGKSTSFGFGRYRVR